MSIPRRRPARRGGSGGSGSARRPGRSRQLLVAHRRQLGDPLSTVVGRRASAATSGPSPDGRRPADPGQRAEGLRRRHGLVRRAGPQQADRRRGRSRPGSSCAAPRIVSASRSPARCSRASRAAPSGSDQATSGALVGAAPRPRATRRRCRRRPAGPRTSRTTGVRRGRSAAPRPRPASTPMSTPVRSLTRLAARRRSCWRRGPPTSRTASMSSQPLSSATTSAEATKSASASMPAADDRAGRRRGARPAAAAPCGRRPGAGRRPRGRRPPAGGRCWNRCRARPGAWSRICSRHVRWPGARSRPGLSPRVGRVRRSRRRRPGVPVRPDLADVELDVHLRAGLPRDLRRRRPTPAAAPWAPTSPTRTTRSGSRVVGELDAGDLAVPPRPARSKKPTGSRHDEEGEPQDPHRRASTASRPASSTTAPDFATGAGLRAARARARAGPRPAGDQARRLLAAADPAYVPRPSSGRTRRPTPRSRSPSTTAAAGARAATTSTGTAPATPRPTSRVEPLYVTNEPELVELMGRAAYDALVGTARRTCGRARRSRSHPADPH